MSSQTQSESNSFTISLANAVPLIPRLSLVDKPLDDIPLLPGESIHLGYTPMTDEEAFAAKSANCLPLEALPVSHFRMVRDDTNIDELAEMIHRFIAINDAVQRLVPKRQYINYEPGKRLYESKVTHSWRNHHATIQVRVIALPAQGSDDVDEYAVIVHRLCGSVTAHRMFFHTLEQYVQSYGHSYPLIRPVSIDREALAQSSPPEQVTWCRNEHQPLGKLQRQSRIDEPEDVYNREESDEDWDDSLDDSLMKDDIRNCKILLRNCESASDGEYPSSDEEPIYQAIPFRDVISSKNIPDHYSSDEESN